MNLYFAGATAVEDGYPELQKEVTNRLISYYYQTDSLDDFYYNKEREKYQSLILDSGAFSAWSQGASIDVVKYADYCLKWQDKCSLIVNLDVIPARPGIKKIPIEEIERSASVGYQNYEYLLSRGVDRNKLIHVFHQNESFKWLEKMMEEQLPYIGISPANDRTVTEKKLWLNDCMPYITDSEGKATVKFHGFAVTSFDLMRRYPWESVDSSTWAVAGGRGVGMVPHTKNGGTEWNWGVEPRKLTLSCIENRKEHFKWLTSGDGEQKRQILKYLEEIKIPFGESKFRCAYKDEVLQEGVRPVSNSFVKHMIKDDPDGLKIDTPDMKWDTVLPQGVRWVEVVTEKGAINYWKYRQYMNAYFLNRFVELLNSTPRLYKPSVVDTYKGFECELLLPKGRSF